MALTFNLAPVAAVLPITGFDRARTTSARHFCFKKGIRAGCAFLTEFINHRRVYVVNKPNEAEITQL